MACYTREEIGEAVGVSHQAVAKVLQPNEPFRFVAKVGQLREAHKDCRRSATNVSAFRLHEAARKAIEFFNDPFWKGPKPTCTCLTSGHRIHLFR